MLVVGAISGTSVDGIDVAAAHLSGADSGRLLLQPLADRTVPWRDRTREMILSALPPGECSASHLCRLDVLTGEEIAAAVRALVHELPEGRADLVVSHGQTLYHWIEDGVARGGLQLGQPAPIVEATGLPVVSDVRSRDIAAGGQGAPLAGMLDVLVLGGLRPGPVRATVNLGGIANVTVAGPAGARAFDTGPADCLIDDAVRRMTGGHEHCDLDGRRARRGTVDQALLRRLLADPYYRRTPPKSTGREYFHGSYVPQVLRRHGSVSHDDLVATLTELTAVTVADALRAEGVQEVYGSGGGMHNPALVERIAHHLAPATVQSSAQLGLPVDGKEAYLMALIGYLTWHGIPAVPDGVDGPLTGATRRRVLGRISPGDGPMRLPAPCPSPTSLHIDPSGN